MGLGSFFKRKSNKVGESDKAQDGSAADFELLIIPPRGAVGSARVVDIGQRVCISCQTVMSSPCIDLSPQI